MRWFLLFFFGTYGAMHAYAYWKINSALNMALKWRILQIVVMLLLILTPIFVRMLDKPDTWILMKIVARIGFSWMAILFWFCVAWLIADAWNLLVWIAGFAAPAARHAVIPAKPALMIISGLVVFLTIWGLIEASTIRVEKLAFSTEHLPSDTPPIRIILVADLHLGVHVSGRRLARLLDEIEKLNPDILLSAGDLIDSSGDHTKGVAKLIAELDTPLGQYGVMGNHEFYVGITESLEFHKAAGITMLRQASMVVTEGLSIAGVDDPAGRYRGDSALLDEELTLPSADREEFTILIKHQPYVEESSIGRFDLQVSGHSHGGQIFPFSIIVKRAHPYFVGLYELSDSSHVYVSRGTGTWGPPMRVFMPPEITYIELMPKKNSE